MSETFRAAGMRGFDTLMDKHGIAPEPLLEAAGIPLEALTEDDLRVSLLAYSEVLETAAQQTQQPDLGLQMSEHQDISVLGPLAIAMQNAATIGQGVEVCSRYLHIHSPGIRLSVHPHVPESDLVSLRLTLVLPSWLPSTQVMEQCLANLLHFLVWLSQTPVPTLSVGLSHPQCAEDASYVAAFGCLPSFDQAHAELCLPLDYLDRDLGDASESLHRFSLDYLQLRYAPGTQTVTEQVEAVLRKALATTGGRRDRVAALLRMHPRTMLRRLADEGTTFKAILEETRMAECRRWVCESNTPLAQIPPLLGLSDQSVLTRCCQAWFGTTPAKLRQQEQ